MSNQIDHYFHDLTAGCPYEKPHPAIYRQARFGALPPLLMATLLEAGYRRNGSSLYRMVCPDCQACQPIRVLPEAFRPNRNQRRVARQNADLTVKIVPLELSTEKLALCEKFLQSRYPGRGNSAIDYYTGFFLNSMVNTVEVEYRLEDRLLGVAIIDLCDDSMNCVYCYFEPELAHRSPGIFNILHLLEFARRNGLARVYLGYWIKDLSAMSYKSYFRPHQLLVAGEWVTVER